MWKGWCNNRFSWYVGSSSLAGVSLAEPAWSEKRELLLISASSTHSRNSILRKFRIFELFSFLLFIWWYQSSSVCPRLVFGGVESEPLSQHPSRFRYGTFSRHSLRCTLNLIVCRLVELHKSVLRIDIPPLPSLPSAVLVDDNLSISVLCPRDRARQ